ncbi:hypothetical protein B0H11DRAFT_1934448 [Mycena galericulata]|nr:hypothetical protein B0H11DRAFT_1934448 [Mycena galericulata]
MPDLNENSTSVCSGSSQPRSFSSFLIRILDLSDTASVLPCLESIRFLTSIFRSTADARRTPSPRDAAGATWGALDVAPPSLPSPSEYRMHGVPPNPFSPNRAARHALHAVHPAMRRASHPLRTPRLHRPCTHPVPRVRLCPLPGPRISPAGAPRTPRVYAFVPSDSRPAVIPPMRVTMPGVRVAGGATTVDRAADTDIGVTGAETQGGENAKTQETVEGRVAGMGSVGRR